MNDSNPIPVEVTLAYEINAINEDTERVIRQARDMRNFIKTATGRDWVKFAISMRCDTITSYPFISGSTMYITLRVTNLEGFKDTRLEGILAALMYKNPDHTSTNDFAAEYSREFIHRYKYVGSNVEVIVSLTAVIKNDSKTCERVVVGMTEGKPQPIYKLVCDGQEQPPTDQITLAAE